MMRSTKAGTWVARPDLRRPSPCEETRSLPGGSRAATRCRGFPPEAPCRAPGGRTAHPVKLAAIRRARGRRRGADDAPAADVVPAADDAPGAGGQPVPPPGFVTAPPAVLISVGSPAASSSRHTACQHAKYLRTFPRSTASTRPRPGAFRTGFGFAFAGVDFFPPPGRPPRSRWRPRRATTTGTSFKVQRRLRGDVEPAAGGG